MATISPRFVFRSALFATEPGEDESTNPGIFGKALAIWIGRELVPGFTEDGIVAEDFGWLVAVPNPHHSLYIACSSTDESAQEWQLMAFAEGGLLSRLFGKGKHRETVDALYAQLKSHLEAEAAVVGLREEQ